MAVNPVETHFAQIPQLCGLCCLGETTAELVYCDIIIIIIIVIVRIINNNNNNNNNNNYNRIQRCYSRFSTISSQRRELFPTRTLKWPRRNRVQITCNTSSAYHVQHIVLRATWYEGTAQLLSLTELKSHLFELYFVG